MTKHDPLAEFAVMHEYSRAANPIGAGITPKMPAQWFPPSTHRDVDVTAIIPLDLSTELGMEGPATSPALSASFVRIVPGTPLDTAPIATSELYFVMHGAGSSWGDDLKIPWEAGDVFVVPAGLPLTHEASADATLYRVTDEPLLRHLGVVPITRRFEPTRFTAEMLQGMLADLVALPHALDRNRLAVLMSTEQQAQTLTITQVLWAMFGVVPAGAVQKAHRHQSVALDLIVSASPGCFTLLGRTVDSDGQIIDPQRIGWESGCAFTTPPGMWHTHVNESDEPAYLLPVQDAGLLTHLRALDIRFT